ncbi:MAG: hypothetical protein AAF967_14940, partial [Pseudomonadota bacterium]
MSCCALALGLAAAPEASGQTTWQGDAPDPDGTNWFVGENWNTGIVPGIGGVINVDVDIVNAVTNQPIIDGSDPLDEFVNLGTGEIQVDRGLLTIRNEGELGNYLGRIGQELGSNGAVTVTGDRSLWENTSNLFVGQDGTGMLNIEDGGAVTSVSVYMGYGSDSRGEVRVTGDGSIWDITGNHYIGSSSTAILTVADGGTVFTGGSAYMGFSDTGNGEVTVTGDDSEWRVGAQLVVGSLGTGILTIADRGTVTVGGGTGVVRIAHIGGSFGTVNIGAPLGATPVAPGTLNAGPLEFGEGTATLNFNHTDESGGFEFAPGVSGFGTINHVSGFTNFTGNSSGFMDTTNVNGGTLSVNNVLGGTVIVDGGRL